ncbi:MAG TPA: hypothetical protein VJ761_12965 [Ktedonobacteraceae bacterium]|nr:hypothetical protein [Ktedonobacteraceae bacterium]
MGQASQWLPANIGSTYQVSSASIEFFSIITLAFFCYCLAAWFVGRWTGDGWRLPVYTCIWLGAVLAGAIYLVTPGVLAHDIEAYAGYSRLLAVYHANPYFVTLSAFPRDPVTPTDVWAAVPSAYGPIWMVICAVLGWLLKQPTPEAYVIGCRVFALAMHLLNIWLVSRTLYIMGRSPRIRALRMLLYGWSPLVLLESAQNGHDDVFMLTFVLLGILLLARANQRGELLHARGYLAPILAFTLAALVKYPILPVLAAYLLLLLCMTLRPTAASSLIWREALANWRLAVRPLGWACLASIALVLAFYVPFWLGHSPNAVIKSFSDNPVATWAENSYMRSVINWLHVHPEQKDNPLLMFLSWRQVWDVIEYIAIALCLFFGVRRLWVTPTVETFLTIALATMCIVLLLTPWFFTWYGTWIVGLAVVCLPARRNRVVWAFFILALTFSYSTLSLYLFNHDLLGPIGYLVSLFDTVPPICAFLFCWIWYPRHRPTTRRLAFER